MIRTDLFELSSLRKQGSKISAALMDSRLRGNDNL